MREQADLVGKMYADPRRPVLVAVWNGRSIGSLPHWGELIPHADGTYGMATGRPSDFQRTAPGPNVSPRAIKVANCAFPLMPSLA